MPSIFIIFGLLFFPIWFAIPIFAIRRTLRARAEAKRQMWSADEVLAEYRRAPDLDAIVEEVRKEKWTVKVKGRLQEIARPQISVSYRSGGETYSRNEGGGPELTYGQEVKVRVVKERSEELFFLAGTPPLSAAELGKKIRGLTFLTAFLGFFIAFGTVFACVWFGVLLFAF